MSRTMEKFQRQAIRLVEKHWPYGAGAAAAVIALAIALPLLWPGHYEARLTLRYETSGPGLAGRELLERLDTPELRAGVAADAKVEPGELGRALKITTAKENLLRVDCISSSEAACTDVARSVRARLVKGHVLSSVPLSAGQRDDLTALRGARETYAQSVEALAQVKGVHPSGAELAALRGEVAKLKTDCGKARADAEDAEKEIARLEAELKEFAEKPAPEPDPKLAKDLSDLEKRSGKIERETVTFKKYATKDHPALGVLAAEAKNVEEKLGEIRAKIEAADPILQARAQREQANERLVKAKADDGKAEAEFAIKSKALTRAEAGAEEFAKLAAARDKAAAEVARLKKALPEGAEKTFTVTIATANGEAFAEYRRSPFALSPVLLGFLILVAAFGAMLARKYIAAEIRTRKDLAVALDLPVLGELPRLARARY